MTIGMSAADRYGIKYDKPSPWLVDYLQKELQNLEPYPNPTPAEINNQKFKRKKEGQNTIAKDKKDTFKRIYQGFVDMIYFLEFVENHQELHELFDRNLKDLFGIHLDDNMGDRSVWHWSLFKRFLSASLFNDIRIPEFFENRKIKKNKEYDFRIILCEVMISQALLNMRPCLNRPGQVGVRGEWDLFESDTKNTELWAKLLSGRCKDKDLFPHTRIRHTLPPP